MEQQADTTIQQLDSKFRVHTLLSQLYASSISPKQRKEAERDLNELGNNVIHHVSDLADIIGTQLIPADNPMKQNAAVYLRSYLNQTYKSFALENSEVQYVGETLVRLLTSPGITLVNKQQLVIGLEGILNIDTKRGEGVGLDLAKRFILDCTQEFVKMVETQAAPLGDYLGMLMVLQALIKQCSDKELLIELFTSQAGSLKDPLMKLASTQLLTCLKDILLQVSSGQPYPQELIQSLNERLQIVRQWIVIHLDLIKKFKKLKFSKGLKLIASGPDFANLIASILRFNLQQTADLTQTGDLTLISASGLNVLDLIINETKAKALTAMKIVWGFLFKKKPKAVYSEANEFVISSVQFAPVILNTLIYLGQQNLDMVIQNGYINKLMTVSLNCLCIFADEKDVFNAFFLTTSFKIYLQIVLPYLRLTANDRELITEDPKEFVNYSIDICQQQESRTYKTFAAKLLEKIVDNVDGLLTFVVNVNLELMQIILTGKLAESDYAKQIIEKFQLKFTSEEDLLDVLLMSTTILSYAMVKRPELMAQIDQLIVGNLVQLLLPTTSVLIRSRMALFLSFYMDQLFGSMKRTEQEELFERILMFLLSSLALPPTTDKIVSLQALDALSTQVNEPILVVKIQHNFEYMVDTLSNYNMTLSLHAYFDFLADFIKTHYSNFTQDNLVVFMRSLVSRIQKEVEGMQTKAAKKKAKGKTLNLKKGTISSPVDVSKMNEKANIRINKCWNTIRFIAEHDYFADRYLQIIEETLLPLFEYLVNPLDIDFDDDIIFCIQSLLKKSKEASPIMRKIFPVLFKFQEKYKGLMGNLLQTVNLFIVNAKDIFEGDAANMGLLIQMATLSLFKKDSPIILGNNMEGAILLQVLFQNLQGPLVSSAIPDILTTVLSRYNQAPVSPTFTRSLLGVFHSAMILDPNLTLTFIQQSGFTDQYFTASFSNWKQMRISYERKLFALAMTNCLFNSTCLPEAIQAKAGYYMREIVCVLIRQQRMEQKLSQKKKSKKSKAADQDDVNPLIDAILMEDECTSSEEESKTESQEQMQDDQEAESEGLTAKIPQQIFTITSERDMQQTIQDNDEEDKQEELVAESDFKQEEYDLQFNVNQLVTRILDIDEFEYFASTFRKAHAANPQLMNQLLATQFLPKHRDYLKTILATKRIAIAKETYSEAPERPSRENLERMEDYAQVEQHQPDSSHSQYVSTGVTVPRKVIKVIRRIPNSGGDTQNGVSSATTSQLSNQNIFQ